MGADALFELGLGLFLLAARGLWHRDVGGDVENVLAVDGALAQRRPALRVVVSGVRWVHRRRGDVELQVSEVREDLGDSCCPVGVD